MASPTYPPPLTSQLLHAYIPSSTHFSTPTRLHTLLHSLLNSYTPTYPPPLTSQLLHAYIPSSTHFSTPTRLHTLLRSLLNPTLLHTHTIDLLPAILPTVNLPSSTHFSTPTRLHTLLHSLLNSYTPTYPPPLTPQLLHSYIPIPLICCQLFCCPLTYPPPLTYQLLHSAHFSTPTLLHTHTIDLLPAILPTVNPLYFFTVTLNHPISF